MGFGFFGEIDLLSLDVDGMDYWIWKAIEAVTPRVVVLEFNALLLDGDIAEINAGKAFYSRCKTTRFGMPTLAASWITAENVNDAWEDPSAVLAPSEPVAA